MAASAVAAPEPLRAWLPVPADSDFSLRNIPFGIISLRGDAPRVATRLGEHVLDLAALGAAGLLPAETARSFAEGSLNAFMAQGRAAWRAARARIQALLAAADEPGADGALRGDAALCARAVLPIADVTMHLPARIGDYTDYYSSREHATNVGIMFRGAANALQPNWCVCARAREAAA